MFSRKSKKIASSFTDINGTTTPVIQSAKRSLFPNIRLPKIPKLPKLPKLPFSQTSVHPLPLPLPQQQRPLQHRQQPYIQQPEDFYSKLKEKSKRGDYKDIVAFYNNTRVRLEGLAKHKQIVPNQPTLIDLATLGYYKNVLSVHNNKRFFFLLQFIDSLIGFFKLHNIHTTNKPYSSVIYTLTKKKETIETYYNKGSGYGTDEGEEIDLIEATKEYRRLFIDIIICIKGVGVCGIYNLKEDILLDTTEEQLDLFKDAYEKIKARNYNDKVVLFKNILIHLLYEIEKFNVTAYDIFKCIDTIALNAYNNKEEIKTELMITTTTKLIEAIRNTISILLEQASVEFRDKMTSLIVSRQLYIHKHSLIINRNDICRLILSIPNTDEYTPQQSKYIATSKIQKLELQTDMFDSDKSTSGGRRKHTKPTKKPTTKPTKKPTVKPTTKPTTKPTKKPTVKPTKKPVTKPITKKPTTKKPITKKPATKKPTTKKL